MPLHCLRDALHSFSYTTSRFKTARTVLFHDTRLAAIYSTLVFFVLVYVVLIQVSNRRAASFAISHSNLPQLLFNHAHARFEVPSGYANIWSSGIDSSLQSSLQAPDFCTAGEKAGLAAGRVTSKCARFFSQEIEAWHGEQIFLHKNFCSLGASM